MGQNISLSSKKDSCGGGGTEAGGDAMEWTQSLGDHPNESGMPADMTIGAGGSAPFCEYCSFLEYINMIRKVRK